MKRKQRGSHEDDGPEPEFQVAPMADMLFVLLVFFMSITTTEVMQQIEGVTLAHAEEAEDKKKGLGQSEAVINVRWDPEARMGDIIYAGAEYGHPDDLIGILQQRIETAPDLRVLIRADQATEYSYISQIMRACSSAQIANVTFSVLTGAEGQ